MQLIYRKNTGSSLSTTTGFLSLPLSSIITNKASEGDGIPAELFQILKDAAVKMLHSITRKFEKLSSGHKTGKGQFSFQSQRKAMRKKAQTTAQLHLSHTLEKQGSKFSKPGFSSSSWI